MLRSLRIMAIFGVCALALCLATHIARATIPSAPSWGTDYQLVFSQDYTTMSSLSQVGISSGTTIGSGQTWVPTRIPTYLNWAPFIAPNGNNDPFGVGSGYLDIRAQQNQSTTNGFDGFSCGLIGSMDGSGNGFAQEYGYFECSMQTPGGANTWPGFWLLDKQGLLGQTPDSFEIDISESYGNWGTGPGQSPAGDPNEDAVTWHWWNNSNNPNNSVAAAESGMTSGYHTYGVDIEPSGLTFYFDRSPIWNVPTSQLPSPNLLNRAYFVLLDLALGGGNYNNSTNTGYDYSLTPNPSDLKIQYVAVWASPASPNFSGPPGPPSNLAAAPGNQVVALSWSAAVGASTYNIYRGTSSGGENATAVATGVTGTSYVDRSLTNNTTYYYEVASVNTQGTSSKSNEASATPRSGPPIAPSGLTATPGDTQIALSWTASPDGTTYNIYRGNTAGGESGTALATGVTTASYTDTAVTNGTPYFYTVKAVSSGGTSSATNEANGIPASANETVSVAYASTAPPINGVDGSAWSGASVYPISKLALGQPTSTNGVFKVMYDSSNIYYLFTVNDSSLVSGSPDYNGDAVEIYIDGMNNKATSYDSTDLRYTLGYNHSTISGTNTTGVQIAQSTYTGGYREEIAIPWSTLGVTPYAGKSIGLDAAIDDGVSASEGRTSQFIWHDGDATDYYYPASFGNGTLEPTSPGSGPAPGTYKLVNVNSGLVLEVPGASTTVGTQLDQASYTGATAQQWAVTPENGGDFALVNANSGMVADDSPTFNNDYQVVQWPISGTPSDTQRFTITQIGSYYLLTNVFSGKVLAVNGASTSAGAGIVQMAEDQNDNSELWSLSLLSGAAPSAPTGLSATAGNAQVSLTWNASSGATSYKIYRATTSGGEGGTPVASGITGTSYTDTGLTNGTVYYYKIAAVNSAGTSGESNEASATPNSGGGSAPPAPTGLVATAGNAQVSLSWTASSGATSYNVYRGTTSGGENGTPIGTVSTTSYTDTGLTNGATYYYEVKAVNSAGSSSFSNEASATPTSGTGGNGTAVVQIDSGGSATGSWVADTDFTNGTPAGTANTSSAINTSQVANPAPQSVYQTVHYGNFTYTIPSLTAGASYTVRLSFVETWWTGPGEREFNVTINGNQVLTNFDIFATAGGENIAIDKCFTATADTNGKIAVQFTNVIDNSEVSGVEILNGGSSQSPPSAPTSLTATGGNAQVSLSWTGSNGATSYNVYRGTTSSGESGTPIANITTTSYTDTSVTNGTTYYYKVAAVNSAGTSGMSNEASAAPQAAVPAAPTNLVASAGDTTVGLSWTASSGATSYNVYRGTTSGGESGTPVATGITTTSYTDTGLTDGTTYYYKVKAVNGSGSSSYSNEASATPESSSGGSTILQINGGGQAVGSWVGDTDYVEGTPSGAAGTTATIDTSQVTNPAPQQVYQSVHYGNFSYVIPNLTPGAGYTVRLSLVETWWTGAGEREFNVAINGTQVLTNFDIFAAAGGENKAITRSFTTAADGSGNITIQFTNVIDNSEVSGVEILTGSSGGSGLAAPTGLAAFAGNGSVGLTWSASTGASSYNVYRGTTSGGESGTALATGITSTSYTDTSVTNGTTYYYTVKAVSGSTTSSASNEASAKPSAPIIQINCGANSNTGSWIADTDYSGGTVSYTTATIDTSLLTNPPAQSVLQNFHYSNAYGDFTYTIPGFTANANYTVKLYFVETYFTGPGDRECNVVINGSQVLTNFDIYSAAGAENKAVMKQFNVTANSSGDIVIAFDSVIDNAEVSGIEVD